MNRFDRTLNALQHESRKFRQSENSSLTYSVNWSAVIGAETISASVWSADSGVTVSSQAIVGRTATAILTASPGEYRITNKITTSAGAIHERSIILDVYDLDTELPASGDYD